MDNISQLYNLEFEKNLIGANIYCNILPHFHALCFVHCQHDILDALKECFTNDNVQSKIITKEWFYALVVPIVSIPLVPPFKDLNKHYLKSFLDWITSIEELFEKHNVSYVDLLLIKNRLLRKKDISYNDTQTMRLLYEARKNGIIGIGPKFK